MSRKKSTLSFRHLVAVATLLMLGLPAAASALAAPEPGGCDYSAAAQNSGWGWNESNQTSCPPLQDGQPNEPFVQQDVIDCVGYERSGNFGVACFLNGRQVPSQFDGCDYRSAAENNGWGWNPETRRSCQPVVG